MKKLFFSIVIALFFTSIAIAHPLDISNSQMSIKWKYANFSTYFHSFEIEYLLKQEGIPVRDLSDYYNNSDIIEEYIKDHISLSSWNTKCDIKNIEILKSDTYKMLSEWLWVDYRFDCINNISDINLEIKYFLEFPLQTNNLTIYDLNNGISWLKPLISKTLTPKVFSIKINNITDFNSSKKIDSDYDWLSDEEEDIYKTDKNNIDSDWDNYTDREEVSFWWDPLDNTMWPWQKTKKTITKIIIPEKKSEKIDDSVKQNLSDFWFWWKFLSNSLETINNYFEKNEKNAIYIFWIVFLLWIIHAVWPWHSKWLLISYIIDKDKWLFHWLFFALVFTITHLLDLFILFWITKLTITFIDISSYLWYIMKVSGVLLLFLSSYLIYKTLKNKWKAEKKTTAKTSVFIAFLAWLAPCSFWWSLLLLLLTLWKTAWIFPLLIIFWVWIFTLLSILVIVTLFIRNNVYKFVWPLARNSSLVSFSLLFIISIVLILR